jgi:HD-like signal output (HDOD) protein
VIPAPADLRAQASAVPAPRLEVHGLLADVHRLPASRPALLRVVQLADSPDCSARSLAAAAAADPAFTARLLQLANSAYYGRAGRVTAIGPAVGVLGAETLRGLAVTMALGLAGEHGPLPDGFSDRAAATAAGSRLVAPLVDADPGDAFCVGLLREVGQALLFRAAPQSYPALLASCDEAGLAAAERVWCGTTSGEVAEQALAGAGLPASVCRTIAAAQLDDEQRRVPATPLGRALRGGVVLARAVATGEVDDATTAELGALTGGGLDPRAAGVLVLQAASQAAGLSAALD